MPKISVIMSTYNTPSEWLYASIDSILQQTYGDFEFLIADDCSTTNLDEVKSRIDDSRVIWIKNESNLGLTKTLNKLLKMCKGEYIARMDADDISLPERFATQVKFMDEHPEVIVSGSYRRAFGNEEKNEIWNIPATRVEQQVQLFFYNCGLTHPTAMFRKSMLDEYGVTYNENYTKAQDYGIWVQCTRYAPMAMIPKVLLQYRKSDVQISTAGKSNQQLNAQKVRYDQLLAMGITPTEEETRVHEDFCHGDISCDAKLFESWIDKLLLANGTASYFNKTLFKNVLEERCYFAVEKKYRQERDKTFKLLYKRLFRFGYFLQKIKRRIKGLVAKIIRRR